MTDYEALDMFISAMEISPIDYLSYDDYMIAQDWANIQLLLSLIDLIHPVITQLTVEEYQDVLDTVVSVLSIASKGEIDFTYFNTTLISQGDKIMVDLFLDFLVSRDAEYETSLENMLSNPYDPMLIKAFIIENIDLIDQFLDDHSSDINGLIALSTQQQRSDFVYYFMMDEVVRFMLTQQGIEPMRVDEIVNYLQSAIDYPTIESLTMTLSDVLSDMIDEMILSDYQVIDDFFAMMMIDPIDYVYIDDYYEDLDFAQFNLILSVIDWINPVVQDMTIEEYQSVIDAFFMVIDFQLGFEETVHFVDLSSEIYAINALEIAVDQTAINQLNILHDLMAYASTTSYIQDFYQAMTSTTLSEEDRLYTSAIVMATVFYDLNPIVMTDINVISAEILNLLDDEVFVANMNIDPLDVSNIQAFINVQIPEILSQADIIYQYDINNLTFEEIQNIMTFLTIFGMAPAF